MILCPEFMEERQLTESPQGQAFKNRIERLKEKYDGSLQKIEEDINEISLAQSRNSLAIKNSAKNHLPSGLKNVTSSIDFTKKSASNKKKLNSKMNGANNQVSIPEIMVQNFTEKMKNEPLLVPTLILNESPTFIGAGKFRAFDNKENTVNKINSSLKISEYRKTPEKLQVNRKSPKKSQFRSSTKKNSRTKSGHNLRRSSNKKRNARSQLSIKDRSDIDNTSIE